MNILHALEKFENTCVAFGSFEGVHKGHVKVIDKVVEIGREKNLEKIVLSIYDPKAKTFTTEEEKAYLLENSGIDTLVSFKEDSYLDLEGFVKNVLVGALGAKTVVVGESMSYGDSTLLEFSEMAKKYGIEVEVVADVKYQDEKISVELLEKYFNAKDFTSFTEIAGHPYIMLGVVEHGKALGRTVGMPTANLGVAQNKKFPEDGAYATISVLKDERYMGFTNIGKRPSVDNDDRITIETLILDFAKNIYGYRKVIEVHFHIRDVKKFNGLQEVQEQVQKDAESSRAKLKDLI